MDKLTSEVLDLEELVTRIVEKVCVVPNRETPLEQQAEFYEWLRELKDLLGEVTKGVNIAIRETSKSFAFAMADAGEDTKFRTNNTTLTVSAEGYYSINDPKGFLLYLENDTEKFVNLATHKRALTKFCEEILSSGYDLPDCLKYSIVPAIRMTKRADKI